MQGSNECCGTHRSSCDLGQHKEYLAIHTGNYCSPLDIQHSRAWMIRLQAPQVGMTWPLICAVSSTQWVPQALLFGSGKKFIAMQAAVISMTRKKGTLRQACNWTCPGDLVRSPSLAISAVSDHFYGPFFDVKYFNFSSADCPDILCVELQRCVPCRWQDHQNGKSHCMGQGHGICTMRYMRGLAQHKRCSRTD